MKKLLLVFTLLFVTNSFSQTKEETEKWILNKLNRYNSYEDNRYKDHGFYHTEKLVDGVFYFYEANYFFRGTTSFSAKYSKFPINKIERIEYSGGSIEFYLDTYCDKCVYKEYEGSSNSLSRSQLASIVSRLKETVLKENQRLFKFAINTINSREPEENLVERLKKAIEHLKTFYPKPIKKKETF